MAASHFSLLPDHLLLWGLDTITRALPRSKYPSTYNLYSTFDVTIKNAPN